MISAKMEGILVSHESALPGEISASKIPAYRIKREVSGH